MVHQLLNSQLKRMQVEVDIFRGSMKSTWITQENIDRILERAEATSHPKKSRYESYLRLNHYP